MANPDYYRILGVNKDASAAEIKRAFRRQARKCHPDMHPESDKAVWNEKFKEINEAYSVLSDPYRRMIYDQTRTAAYESPSPHADTPYSYRRTRRRTYRYPESHNTHSHPSAQSSFKRKIGNMVDFLSTWFWLIPIIAVLLVNFGQPANNETPLWGLSSAMWGLKIVLPIALLLGMMVMLVYKDVQVVMLALFLFLLIIIACFFLPYRSREDGTLHPAPIETIYNLSHPASSY